VETELKKGCLIRWVIDYESFAAPSSVSSDGVVPQNPIYSYGIVMEAGGTQGASIMVFCFNDGEWIRLNLIHDEIEILSGE
jgi:hypothetical protein